MTNEHPDFYRLVGPFLASRTVHKTLGGVPWDDDGKTWTLALGDDGTVHGFIGLTTAGRVESLYTLPGHRRTAPLLVKAAVETAGHRPLTARVARPMAGAYLAAGFTTVGETANFLTLRHTPETAP